ncbi:MAG: hypothetical protein Q7T61_07145 [Caulobacter sp.]|nr:hypothetical protein [Caulobacter sp.]
MIRKTLPAIAAAALLWPMTASAHWQSTRWDMTVDQVLASAKGRVVHADTGDKLLGQSKKLAGIVPFEGRSYMADFFFSDAGGLTLVRLNPVSADCQAIIDELKARYGASSSPHNGDWKDPKTGDGVLQSFSYQYTPCYTSYRKPGLVAR